jgi:hypothetical protein
MQSGSFIESKRRLGRVSLINSKKPTQKTDYEMDISVFMRVTSIIVTEGQLVVRRQIKQCETQNPVLKLLGQDCKKYYGLE